MTGQRRANWEAKLEEVRAVLDKRISEHHSRQFDVNGLMGARVTDLAARIGKLENRKRIESWVTVAYMVGLAIWWAVRR